MKENLNILPLPDKWPSNKYEHYQQQMDEVKYLSEKIELLVKNNTEAFYSDEEKYRDLHQEIYQKVVQLKSGLAKNILLLDLWKKELNLQETAHDKNMEEIEKMG